MGKLTQKAAKIIKDQKHRKWWQRAVRVMSMVVVFCTTYALILPAITMEQEPVCGMEAHEHTESCYTQQTVTAFDCGIAENAVIVHTHDTLCYDAEGNLICTLPEVKEHSHGEECYIAALSPNCGFVHVHSQECVTVKDVLVCALEETEGHTHGDACLTERTLICEVPEAEGHTHSAECEKTETVLICTEAEGENHTHGEACYEGKQIPCEIAEAEGHAHGESCYEIREVECTLEEREGHTHGDTCYTKQEVFCDATAIDGHVHEDTCYPKQLVCTTDEVVLHVHTETCYDGEGILTCQLPVVTAHVHTEQCLKESTQDVLACELEVHVHDESCYPVEEEAGEGIAYICGSGVHAHIETCYDEDGVLVCTIPEHAHEAACIVEDLDLTADVETELDWQQLFQDMNRSGNWPSDVAAVAMSQLNYRESEKNVTLEGETLKGYTRYGAWYGDPYGDWDTMFASFCLHYAGVEGMPQSDDADAWMNGMKELQLYAAPDSYTPKTGDLIFFDYDQVEEPLEEIMVVADQVGIVAEVTAGTEEVPGSVSFVIGDYEDQVSYVTCELDDVTIVGYTDIPFGECFYMTHEGADFTVTVTVGEEAGIPDTAQLAVREIAEGTEEYDTYYQQSVEALMNNAAEGEELPEVSFARFFDISFLVDGIAVEPAAPVDIQIRYQDMLEKKEEENGLVVHFAKEGVEVLNADTYSAEPAREENGNVLDEIAEFFTATSEKVDTFRFTQDSFSVSGTLFAVTPRAVATATKVQPYQIDNTGNTLYVLYAQIGNGYYALDGNGTPVRITVNGDELTLPTQNAENLMWSFVDKPNDNTDYLYNPVQNNGTGQHLHPYSGGIITKSPWDVRLEVNGDSFKIRGNGEYRLRMTATGTNSTNGSWEATTFYVAKVNGGGAYNVWFDGTLGGMMSYYGAADENRPVTAGEDGTALVELPETWQSPTKYDYTLCGWYDIKNNQYYAVNPNDDIQPTATIDGSTVFYADWIAATYDVGQQNENTVASVDTSKFITTHVFDYNVLFNLLSQSHTGTVSATGHSETWTVLNNGEAVPYNGDKSLGFSFIDYDAGGDISYANSRTEINYSRDQTTPGIIAHVNQVSGKNLLDLLFNPGTSVIGKKYVGTGNYLFQYMDSTTSNYDGEHDGYYYLDARLNAASYNQSAQRFYLYNYLERTSDSEKDGGGGQYSDFLPFNSPYLFEEDQLNSYTDTIRRPGYTYDAKAGNDTYNSRDDAATNYFFGTRTDIEFFLPNKAGWHDEYGNYGNISTRGQHMVFEFHGDDDVWVFVDGKLMLDIGGMHGIQHGSIDFSTGTIAYGADGDQNVQKFDLGEGTHTMTVYYMERGSSQSNCAIYFNIAPRYDLEITKEDVATVTKLNGAVFSIFNDEAMTSPAQLWESEDAYNADMADDGQPNSSTNQFMVKNGIAKCWGISAGKTYYIYETTPPDGYPESDDMIRITLNNRGTATIETTTLHGNNGIATEGFEVIKQDINETLKIVALTVTNQKEGRHTEVRVEKDWAAGSNLPQSISVFLTRDGERYGRTAILSESNGWSYTWTGLEKYRSEGIDDPYVYEVQEVLVPGFITVQGESLEVVDYVDWIRVDVMSDSKTFLLVHNNQAMTCDANGFGWMSIAEAEQDESLSAQWNVTTDHDGFHLKNGLGYTLTYGPSGFYGTQSDASELNQVFYYLNNRLVVHNNDVYYQFGTNGNVVSSDGLAFTLYQKEVMTGLLTNIINEPVVEEDQTYVEVTKVWKDGNDKHANQAVEIHLLADGEDTGRSVILNAANNWFGSFQGLPYYQADGTTVITYTVEESAVTNYLPSYSDPQVLPGVPFSVWTGVTELTEGTFRFSYAGNSLGVSGSSVASLVSDAEDTYQQWTLESSGSGYRLKNVGSGRYLSLSNGVLSTTSRSSSAATISMTNNKIAVGSGYYMELSASHAGVSTNSSNATMLLVFKWVQGEGRPGTGYTVTNSQAYELPRTGGIGTQYHTFSGLLIMAVALVYYVTPNGRKRQKGGARRSH